MSNSQPLRAAASARTRTISSRTFAKSPLELARKEYHDATVEMADLDARLIDAAASLEELKDRHGKSIIHYDIKSKGAEAYLALAKEAIMRKPRPQGDMVQ